MPERLVDLRSDTLTRPTPGMRRAIADAEVGDDAFVEDPTVLRLEAAVAELLGKEHALFFPSGIMANQAAIQALAPRGSDVVLEARAHIVEWEDGAPAMWAGVQLVPVATPDGLLTPELVAAAIRAGGPFQAATGLLCVENTHNAAGGRVLPVERMAAIRAVADEHGLPVHLDGARLWNAAAAAGVPERAWAEHADTVMVTLTKGLGCPVGSLLAGGEEVIRRARRIRRRLGGGMRQVGILAAAGLYALEHHRPRLHEDHERARRLAAALDALPGVHVVPPETNIVMADVVGAGLTPEAVVAAARERGVVAYRFDPRRIRMVTHLDIDDEAIRRAAEVLRDVLGSGAAAAGA